MWSPLKILVRDRKHTDVASSDRQSPLLSAVCVLRSAGRASNPPSPGPSWVTFDAYGRKARVSRPDAGSNWRPFGCR